MTHSVQNHLGVAIGDYDRAIRTFIPGYDDMLETIAWWLKSITPKNGIVIDLGGGTGALAHAILSRLPNLRVEIWDTDPKMMEIAHERLAPFGSRAALRERSFFDRIEQCDAVVASLSLHHIPAIETKCELYANIHAALRSPGVFLNGDATMDDADPGRRAMFRWWSGFMMSKGISEAEAYQHFERWASEDTYHPLAAELAALGKAGFRRPEVFWKFGPITIYGGIK